MRKLVLLWCMSLVSCAGTSEIESSDEASGDSSEALGVFEGDRDLGSLIYPRAFPIIVHAEFESSPRWLSELVQGLARELDETNRFHSVSVREGRAKLTTLGDKLEGCHYIANIEGHPERGLQVAVYQVEGSALTNVARSTVPSGDVDEACRRLVDEMVESFDSSINQVINNYRAL